MPEVKSILHKREEQRVFVGIGPKAGEDGMTAEEERAVAMAAKGKIEAKFGVRFVRWHFDPLAGGSVPKEPVTQQMVRTGVRYPRVQTSHDQTFSEEEQLVREVQGNVTAGAMTMIATGLWVGEYMG